MPGNIRISYEYSSPSVPKSRERAMAQRCGIGQDTGQKKIIMQIF